jgi:hypothetical protein
MLGKKRSSGRQYSTAKKSKKQKIEDETESEEDDDVDESESSIDNGENSDQEIK